MHADQSPIARPCAADLTCAYTRNEADVLRAALQTIDLSPSQRAAIETSARELVTTIRAGKQSRSAIDDLLLEYGLSTQEGVTLMRLAEALIRTPDFATSRALIRDKIGSADWASHAGKSHAFLVNQATNGLRLTAAWVIGTGGTKAGNLLAKLGDQIMDRAVEQAMAIMGSHFVLGRTIDQALKSSAREAGASVAYSYDMLGEAALTHEDADAYFQAYTNAIDRLAETSDPGADMSRSAGLSVKLSALHPRFEYAHRETCIPILVERVTQLARTAAQAGLWLNIDAEEADRMELTVAVFEHVLADPCLTDWPGLGLVVQAYQRRALPLIEHLIARTQCTGRKIAVRLVKGAYWDMEIKRAQELGLASYPVFTRKENTDVSYLACARKLLSAHETIFPQFATHNAHTAAAIAFMAGPDATFEFQRLHGMGAPLHASLTQRFGVPSRIYAPVGNHKDLLPYLVRRLLENGANSSFVNQLMNHDIAIDDIITDPITAVESHADSANPRIPTPRNILDEKRQSAVGIDLTQSDIAACHTDIAKRENTHIANSKIDGQTPTGGTAHIFTSPQNRDHTVGEITYCSIDHAGSAISTARASDWATRTTPRARARILETAADLLEAEMADFLELCVREAGKTLPDAVAEVREAVDFCRYYAVQAQRPGICARAPLGIVACISPWNFPLAIFLGQVTAALSVGNTVIAKPAEQTPIIAAKAVDLLFRAGIPASALQLLIGDGAALGTTLIRNSYVSGICFTGSTRTAKTIAENLADTGRGATPFIAETGGLNAMIIDSTAQLEQAVQDVVDSAFQSAGQRCSACRIVCVQDDIYDAFTRMLSGAMDALIIGDPSDLSTDVGPVIDAGARQMIEEYKRGASPPLRILKECAIPPSCEAGHYCAPTLIEASEISDVTREIFGPVLHLVKFKSGAFDALIDDINALGFGLTMGLHTRLDSRVEEVARRAHVGNLYVNRNQIGAVVGVHPFGGEGLSGTGPKAGGPHYLLGLTSDAGNPPGRAVNVPPETAGPSLSGDLEKQVARARVEGKKWRDAHDQNARGPIIKTLMGTLPGPAVNLGPRLNYAETIALPGPTGEANSLRLFPRGVALCFGGDCIEDLPLQIALALAAGSAVIAVPGHAGLAGNGEMLSYAQKAGLPEGLITMVTYEAGLALINSSIDVVTADGALRGVIGAYLCRREGAILPLLSARDPIARYLHERTLTINTTAAGGNASLLALS